MLFFSFLDNLLQDAYIILKKKKKKKVLIILRQHTKHANFKLGVKSNCLDVRIILSSALPKALDYLVTFLPISSKRNTL